MADRHFLYPTSTALREILDVARSGRVTTVEAGPARFVVVDAEVLRAQLVELLRCDAVVSSEGPGWAVFLPGLPIAGEGDTLTEAVGDLLDALRDYADEWNESLHDTPNHRGNWVLVTIIELSSDEQLSQWVLNDAVRVGP